MDMVNDGKDIRLDTPQAVKAALASGKDLYNPQTGEFWWEYNDAGSIAYTYVPTDDPNLLAVVYNADFNLYEDVVGGLNYPGRITDSIEAISERGEEDAPLIDPRDEVFAQIAFEDDWVIASAENVKKALQSRMPAAFKRAMTAEIAARKESTSPSTASPSGAKPRPRKCPTIRPHPHQTALPYRSPRTCFQGTCKETTVRNRASSSPSMPSDTPSRSSLCRSPMRTGTLR